jgi:hypothetical protein
VYARTLNAEPSCAKFSAETELPNRAKQRIDMELARLTKSNVDISRSPPLG